MRKYLRDGRAPTPRSEAISRVMSANKNRNTKPEMILRQALRKLGISGARFNPKNIIGRPDIVFPIKQLAVFVHGCFWHCCPYCINPLPKTHRKFWAKKFAANRERDARKNKQLKKLCWRVLVLWECKIKKNPVRAAQGIQALLV